MYEVFLHKKAAKDEKEKKNSNLCANPGIDPVRPFHSLPRLPLG